MTLSEKIKACGDIVIWNYGGKWKAGSNENGLECGNFYFDDYPEILHHGDTVDEAVEKLYQELKERNLI